MLDKGLDLTMQTRTLPRQTPALKNEVCDDILLARFKPERGSIGSRASSGNVMTWRSASNVAEYATTKYLRVCDNAYLIVQ